MENNQFMLSGRSFVKKYTPFVITLLLAASCSDNPQHPGYEYMPDMYRSASYETYMEAPASIFKNGQSALTPPEGTIPRGFMPYPYENTPEGYELAGQHLKNPLVLDKELLKKGKETYTKFCVHCHGNTGEGDGSLVSNGKFPPVPSYKSDNLMTLPEGKMFHSITYGKGLMGPHSIQLNTEQRWLIVHYIRNELQK